MSQVKLTLRPPPNVDFVHGYPGIPPGGPDRSQAVVKGAIEVRGPAQGVKAKWVRIELRKVETLPGGGPSNTFYDFVGPSPVNVWTAQGEYETLQNQDFHFSIPIPESIPPTIALGNLAGINYKLVASVCTRGERSRFGSVKLTVVSTEAPIIIDKHDLHSQWPVYCQHEERNLSQDGVNLLVERESTCFGPGDPILITATLKSDSLPIILRGFELSLIETRAFRQRAYAAGKKARPLTQIAIICEGKTMVNATLYGGTQHKANISCIVPLNHTTATLNATRYIDVTYTLQVEAIMGIGNNLSIDFPVIISNWRRHVLVEAIRRIGPVENLGSTRTLMSTSRLTIANPFETPDNIWIGQQTNPALGDTPTSSQMQFAAEEKRRNKLARLQVEWKRGVAQSLNRSNKPLILTQKLYPNPLSSYRMTVNSRPRVSTSALVAVLSPNKSSTVPQYLTAESEKAALRRHEEAKRVDRTEYSGFDDLGQGSSMTNLTEKERMRLAYDAQDIAALLARRKAVVNFSRHGSSIAPAPLLSPAPTSSPPPLMLRPPVEYIQETRKRKFQVQDAVNTTNKLQLAERREYAECISDTWNASVNQMTIDVDLRQFEYKPDNLSGFIVRDENGARGGGAFADVYKGTLAFNKQVRVNVAIKVIRSHIYKDDNKWKIAKRLRREIRMWGSLQHPNILPLLGVTFDFGPHEAMVCPWMEDGDLDHYLDRGQKTLKLYNRFDILHDVTEGLLYLHSKAIIHGDLTSANILLNNGKACLCDFGLSSLMVEFRIISLLTSTVGGACRWAAPELYSFESETETKPTITKASDIYSFGSISLQVISGQRPYGEIQRNEQVMLELFHRHLPQRPLEPLLNDSCWDFINLCWRIDSTRRPDIKSVKDQLRILRSEYDVEQLLRTLTIH